MEADKAFELDQLSVADCPLCIEVGVADMLQVAGEPPPELELELPLLLLEELPPEEELELQQPSYPPHACATFGTRITPELEIPEKVPIEIGVSWKSPIAHTKRPRIIKASLYFLTVFPNVVIFL